MEETTVTAKEKKGSAASKNGKPKIAYFSMEIGIDEHIPTYSGGLGILAGDTLKSCADLNVPIVGVTLLSEHGIKKAIKLSSLLILISMIFSRFFQVKQVQQ